MTDSRSFEGRVLKELKTVNTSLVLGRGTLGLATARLATAVAVTQTMSVRVAAVESVMSTVDMEVDVWISAITTVARCVAVRVSVCVTVEVTVTGSLRTRQPAITIVVVRYIVDLHRGDTLALGADLVTRAATRPATHLAAPAAVFSINATVPTAGTEVNIIAKAVVGPVGETVPPPHVQDAFLEAEQRRRPRDRICPCVLAGAVSG